MEHDQRITVMHYCSDDPHDDEGIGSKEMRMNRTYSTIQILKRARPLKAQTQAGDQ